jgi:hypothetical protein
VSGNPKQRLVHDLNEQTVLQLEKILGYLRNMLLEIEPRGDLLNIQRLRPVSLEDLYVHAEHQGNLKDCLARSFYAFQLNKHRDIQVFDSFGCSFNLVG